MELNQALKVVRLAGYRVSKPKPKKAWRVGPTCVTTFADGSTFRMTTHSDDEKLDYERGLRLCLYAWESRNKRSCDTLYRQYGGKLALSIHFERNGEVIGRSLSLAA